MTRPFVLRAAASHGLLLFFVLSGCAILSGCAASSRLLPGYVPPVSTDGALAVLPVQGVPFVEDPAMVTDALGGGLPDAVFADFLRTRLAEVLPSEGTFDRAVLVEAPDVALTPRSFEGGVRLPLPPDGTVLDLGVGGAPAAFALFLGNAEVGRGERRSNPNATAGLERLVVVQVDYVLWDVAQARPAVAGRARVEHGTSVTNPVNQTFFERRAETVAEEIVRGTPFER